MIDLTAFCERDREPTWRTTPLSDGGFTYDVGGFLDLVLIPLIDIGVHGGYNHISVDDRGGGSYAFGTAGIDVALKF